MKAILKKHARRERRKKHVRKHIMGSSDRPRLTVFRSHKNQQVADGGGNRKAAAAVGQALAAKAKDAGITRVVFDRNGYAFHGRIADLVEAARKGGLEF